MRSNVVMIFFLLHNQIFLMIADPCPAQDLVSEIHAG